MNALALMVLLLFQSTRPIRGATACICRCKAYRPFQSTRPIRGATPWFCCLVSPSLHFNPRAPYGARPAKDTNSTADKQFQSTRPIRGATVPAFAVSVVPDISIHAPHTGRDVRSVLLPEPFLPFQSTRPIRGATDSLDDDMEVFLYFNPRAPYGARRRLGGRHGNFSRFQSTRPIRGATATALPIR